MIHVSWFVFLSWCVCASIPTDSATASACGTSMPKRNTRMERSKGARAACVSTTRRRATSLETEDSSEQWPVHAHIKFEQVGTAALVVVNI